MAQVLTNLLGQCNSPLEHRAHVTLKDGLTVEGDINLPISLTGTNYAVAVDTWVRAATHGSYVMCRAATDPIGTLTDDATQFAVYLPRSNAVLDPLVYAGDILQYETVGGVNYAVGDAYLQEKIGSFKPMTINGPINGWLKCDGTAGTPNMVGLFVRGGATYGGLGGSDTHGHTGSITTDNASVTITGSTATTALSTTGSSGTTDPRVTGITIADHPDHVHDNGSSCIVEDAATGPAVALAGFTGPMLDETGAGPIVYSHSITDAGHDHDIGSHTHPVSPNPHDHGAGTLAGSMHNHTGSVSINNGDNVPEYIEVVWYVRTGPAGELV